MGRRKRTAVLSASHDTLDTLVSSPASSTPLPQDALQRVEEAASARARVAQGGPLVATGGLFGDLVVPSRPLDAPQTSQEAPGGDLLPTPYSGLPPLADSLAALVARGDDIEAAVASLGLTPEVAGVWMHSEEWVPLVRSKFMTAEQVEDELKRLTPAAIKVKESLLRDTDVAPQLRNAIADDILDRAGHKAIASKTVNVFVFSPERVAHIKESLLKTSATITVEPLDE